MNLRRILTGLVHVIADEAERNADFRTRLEDALGDPPPPLSATGIGAAKRKGGRRTPAVLDPVDLARHGESALRSQLMVLDIEKLRDIVAQFGMDPGKLVMKWKEQSRVIDRIVEVSMARATKGDAFRGD